MCVCVCVLLSFRAGSSILLGQFLAPWAAHPVGCIWLSRLPLGVSTSLRSFALWSTASAGSSSLAWRPLLDCIGLAFLASPCSTMRPCDLESSGDVSARSGSPALPLSFWAGGRLSTTLFLNLAALRPLSRQTFEAFYRRLGPLSGGVGLPSNSLLAAAALLVWRG